MKTVYIKEPGKIELADVAMPTAGMAEALLKVEYAGICGADIATFTGNQPFATYPRVPGHEFSARIVELPGNNGNLKVGDIVTANPYFNCGSCYSCKRGLVNSCVTNQTMGVQRDGAFAEYIVMPVDRIYKNSNLSAKKLALVEPFTIGYHALNRALIKEKDKVLIMGGGAIGMFALISARLKKAEVTVVDMIDKRLKMASDFGASNLINIKEDDFVKRVKEITENNGFDICVEAVGHAKTFLTCIESAATGANIILIGNGKQEVTFNHSILLKKELNLFGSRNSTKEDFLAVMGTIENSDLDIKKLITDVYDKESAVEAFNDLVNNNGNRMKSLIRF